MDIVSNTINNTGTSLSALQGTIQSSVSTPEAALKIELNKDLVRYLFFQTVTDDTVNFQSQMTDNWVENNTAIQDHIAISPVIITMRGFVGELAYTSTEAELDYERELAQANAINSAEPTILQFGNYFKQTDSGGKLSAISAFFPEVSNVTQLAQNMWDKHEASQRKARRIFNTLFNQNKQTLNSKMTAYSGLSSNLRESKLKETCETLKNYWLNRLPLTADTPFGNFDNMYITSVSLHQGNENFIGEIDITLKQLRFAQTLTTEADKDVLAKYNAYARAQEENNGKAQGRNVSAIKEFSDNYLGTTPGSGIKRD